jgi:hypothetical protein
MSRLRSAGPRRRSGRRRLPFVSVNRAGEAGYRAGMQRHHLLPLQLLSARCFGPLFDRLGRDRVGFDDFRRNGLLLPATEKAAVTIGLPLHRGPHGDYNRMVAERVGQIEAHWAATRPRDSGRALEHALMRLALLQSALRRRLLAESRRLRLNRLDPLGAGRDFSQIDALVEDLWRETGRDQRTKSDSASMVLPPIASRNRPPPVPLPSGAMA